MRFCQDHWDRLRRAIEDRGLSDLIAPDGRVAMRQLADQLERAGRGEEPETPVNYDPLMAAHWAIVSNVGALARGAALELMRPNEDGSPRCPLCWANSENPHGYNYDEWIDRAADDQAAHVAEMRQKS